MTNTHLSKKDELLLKLELEDLLENFEWEEYKENLECLKEEYWSYDVNRMLKLMWN